jgi:hypothetical protein
MEIQHRIQAVTSLYGFFNKPNGSLEYLVRNDHSFEHFYKEYVGGFKAIEAGYFGLFLTKSSFGQIAQAFQGIYNRCTIPESEYNLMEEYFEELVSIRALHLWFNNFRYDQMEKVFIDFPDFGTKFMGKKEKGFATDIVTAESLFELFFTAEFKLQEKLMQTAMASCGNEVKDNITFNMDILQ